MNNRPIIIAAVLTTVRTRVMGTDGQLRTLPEMFMAESTSAVMREG